MNSAKVEKDEEDDASGTSYLNRTEASYLYMEKVVTPLLRLGVTPLLTLKREDLVIYEFREEETTYRNALNFDKIVGQEELLNYCYGRTC